VKFGDDFLGQSARVLAEAFGDRHDAIRLVIAEFRVGTRTNNCGTGIFSADGRAQSTFDGVGNDVGRGGHYTRA